MSSSSGNRLCYWLRKIEESEFKRVIVRRIDADQARNVLLRLIYVRLYSQRIEWSYHKMLNYKAMRKLFEVIWSLTFRYARCYKGVCQISQEDEYLNKNSHGNITRDRMIGFLWRNE